MKDEEEEEEKVSLQGNYYQISHLVSKETPCRGEVNLKYYHRQECHSNLMGKDVKLTTLPCQPMLGTTPQSLMRMHRDSKASGLDRVAQGGQKLIQTESCKGVAWQAESY